MPTESTEEVVLPDPEEESTTESEEETSQEEAETIEEEEEKVELTAEEKLVIMEEKYEKSQSEKKNLLKAVKAEKNKNKPKELPAKEEGFVSKKEFYQESKNKAINKAKEAHPELAKDEHWNEIIKEYNPKTRDGKTVEENTFINLENAVILWNAKQTKVDNSGKAATAEAASSKTSPSKGDTSQSKKSDNTESEDFYLKKFGLEG